MQRASAGEEAVARKMRRLLPDLEPKLVPTVKQLPRSESVIRSGVLMLLRNSQANQWDKLHFVLRRWVRFPVTLRQRRNEDGMGQTHTHLLLIPSSSPLSHTRLRGMITDGGRGGRGDGGTIVWYMLTTLPRPYLHVHTALTEREVQVINLTRANVVASPDVEMLLEVSGVTTAPTDQPIDRAPRSSVLRREASSSECRGGERERDTRTESR